MTCDSLILERLPKGSACQEFKDVPARSSYWRDGTDSVTRCDSFDTDSDRRSKDGGRRGGGGGERGEDRDELPKRVAGYKLESHSERKAFWIGTRYDGAPATVPREGQLDTVVSIRSHGGRFEHRWTAEVKWKWPDGEKQQTLVQAKRQDETSNFNRALSKAVEWMENNPSQDFRPEDATEGYDGPTVMYEGVKSPQHVEGWDYTTDYEFAGIDERDEHSDYLVWEKYGTDTPTDPTTNRSILVLSYQNNRRGSSGHQASVWHVDVNGNKRSASIDDPDKPRSDPEQAVEAAVSYMENNPEEIPEYDYPSLDLRGENRTLKYWTRHVSRLTDNRTRFNVHIGKERLRAKDTDGANVYMTDTRAIASGFESYSVSDPGWVSIDIDRLWDYVREGGVTDTVRLYTAESDEKAVPPYLEVEIDGEEQTNGLKRVWLHDQGRDTSLPDLDDMIETTVETTGKELKRQYKAAHIVGSEYGLYAEDGDCYMVTQGDVDNFRGRFDRDVTEVSGETEGSWYSDQYMKTMRMVRKPSSTDITLKFGENTPIVLEYETDGMAVTDLLAPRIRTDDDEFQPPADVTLSQPLQSGCETLLSQPMVDPDDVPGHVYSSLQDAWKGYEIAISRGDRTDAKKFACVINGIRAGIGQEPMEFDKLDGFKCEPHRDGTMAQPTDCPAAHGGLMLAEPLQAGDPVPDAVADRLDTEGDTVLWFFPNTDGCRCGTQAQQFDTLAAEHGVTVYGVANSDPDELREMGNRLDLSITLISDPDGALADDFGVETENGGFERRTFFIRNDRVIDVSDGVAAAALEQPDPCQTVALEQKDKSKLFETLEHPGVYVVTGQRGSGKSSLAMRIAEGMHDRDDVTAVTVGMPKAVREEFPGHWIHVENIGDAPPNSVVVIDEAYAKFHARDAMSDENKSVGQMVNTSRHCGQTFLFVSQNAAHLDVGAASEADGLLMKEPGTFHMEFERKQFRDLSETAKESFEQLPESMDNREFVYVYTDDFQGMVRNDETDWYNDAVSRSHLAGCELDQPPAVHF